MEKYLNSMFDLLLPLKDIFLYIFLFVSSVVENLFPPVPGDMITLFGAFLVGTGRLNYFLVYLCTTLGSVIGFMLLFLAVKYFSGSSFVEKNYKRFPEGKRKKAEKWIRKYGYWIIIANRFLPGVRSFISIVSGISKLNSYLVLIFSLISAALWNLIWIQVGFLLGSKWEIVKEEFVKIMRNYNIIAFIIIIVIVILIISYKYRKRKKRLD